MLSNALRAGLLVVGLAMPALSQAAYPSAFDCKGKDSFNWYCKEEKKAPMVVEEKREEKKEEIKKEEPAPLTYEEEMLKKFDEMQIRLENLKKIAIVDPTEKNLINYIAYQLEVQDKASVFADTWKRVQWSNPELDYQQRFTTNSFAKKVQQEELSSIQLETLTELSNQGWGLWFFYASTCPYCKGMVTPINIVHEQGLQVIPITIDGIELEGLEMPSMVDSGQAHELGVERTPTIFLAHKVQRLVVPISYGVVSYREMMERIYTIVKTKPGEKF